MPTNNQYSATEVMIPAQGAHCNKDPDWVHTFT